MERTIKKLAGFLKPSQSSEKGFATVDEHSGRFQISTQVSERDLETLAANSVTKTIQFADPLSDKQVELLEKIVFSKRPDILLRIYGHYGKVCDLSFIERIPSLRKVSADCLIDAKEIEVVTKLKNLEHLAVGIFDLDNFDFLDGINPNITQLSLSQTRSKKPKIKSISRFTKLELLYLEGQQNGIESVKELKNLQRIVLRSISTKNIEFVEGLSYLWSVDVNLGGIKNFDALSTLPQIKYLELRQVGDLRDLSFVSRLATLQNLYIQSLKQVEELPDFTECISLRRIYLENMKSLKDLSSLRLAPNLREFTYVLAHNQEPKQMQALLENPNVEDVFCRFGSDRKNRQFDDLALKHGKLPSTSKEFIYE